MIADQVPRTPIHEPTSIFTLVTDLAARASNRGLTRILLATTGAGIV